MLCKIVFNLGVCLLAIAAAKVTYEGYKVYELCEINIQKLPLLIDLWKNSKYIFFNFPHDTSEVARILVAPQDQSEFELHTKQMKRKISNNNFGATLADHEESNQLRLLIHDYTISSSSYFSFSAFNSFLSMNQYLDTLADSYSCRVKVQHVGTTYEQRITKAITITNGYGGNNKSIILIDGGMHPREWMSPAVAFYVIHQLVEKFDENALLLDYYDWVILPIVNPDGYVHTHEVDRLWYKNRKPSGSTCYGTNIFYNCRFPTDHPTSRTDPCDLLYQGAEPFSEPETKAWRDLMLSVKDRAKLYLTLHTNGGKRMWYPWSTSNESMHRVESICKAGIAAVQNHTGSKIKVSQIDGTHGPEDCADYAFDVANIPTVISYAVDSSFCTPPGKVQSLVEEAWTAIHAMVNELRRIYK